MTEGRYAPGAPPEIWGAPDIDAGTKLTLMALWSWADHKEQREIKTVTVYAKHRDDMTPTECLIARIVEQTGATPRAVREHLKKCKAAGYATIRRGSLAATLHWPPLQADQRQSVRRQRVKVGHPNVCATMSENDTTESCKHTTAPASDATMSENYTTASCNKNPPQPPMIHPDPPMPVGCAQKEQASAANPHLAGLMDRHRKIAAKNPAEQFALIPPDLDPPKRDIVGEVLAIFNAEVAGLRAWAGKSKAAPCTMTKGRRNEIEARLAEIEGGPDEKIAACRRVFEVQAHQIRANGKTPADPDRAKRDWASFNTSTLFQAKNFTRWLDRWSEDGDHVLWFQPRRRHDANYSAAHAHGVAEQDAALYQRRLREADERLAGTPKGEDPDEWY